MSFSDNLPRSTRTPRVTYLMATFNRVAFIGKALENFRTFITPEDELIVIDGASTDGTVEILEANRDLITTLVSEPDLGESHAFNKGLLLSRGEIIKFLTDDDLYYPDAMCTAIEYMKEHPEVDLLMCAGENYSEGVGRMPDARFPAKVPFGESFYYAWRYRIISGLGWLMRRTMLAKVGIFDLGARSVDIAYLSRAYLAKATIHTLDVPLYRHYHHADSGMTRYERQVNRDIIVALREHGLHWQAMLRVVRLWKNLPGKVLYRALMAVDSLVWRFKRPDTVDK